MDQFTNILLAASFVLVLAAFVLAFGNPLHTRARQRPRVR
jgi:hypothetical protein